MARYHNGAAYPESEEFLGESMSGIGLLGEGEEELAYLHEGEEEEEYEVEAEDELEGLYEGEFEDELEALMEEETEDEGEGEEFIGDLVRAATGLLGEGEEEAEYEWEDEGEEFFGKIGGFLRKAAPLLKTIAKTAGPLIATAVGGPAAGLAARAITSQLEGETETEDEGEGEYEIAHREATNRTLTSGQAAAELMAAQAAAMASEAEAEALIGAAAVRALAPRDRAALEALVPSMVRGAAVLTRLLYGSRGTRPFIRVVPTVVDGTARSLLRQAHRGGTVTPATAARTMAVHAHRVLGNTRRCRQALHRNRRGIGKVRRYAPGQGRRRYGRDTGRVTRGVPVRTRTYPSSYGGYPSRRGVTTMRLVTPVRVPGSGGRPSRLVRVVTDVRVPRGAVPARRTATVLRGPRSTPRSSY